MGKYLGIRTGYSVESPCDDVPAEGDVLRVTSTAIAGSTNASAEWGKITHVNLSSGFSVKSERSLRTGVAQTGTAQIPYDDTAPQITEGTEFLTLSHTPTATGNRLQIDVVCYVAHSAISTVTAALFVDAQANALTAAAVEEPAANAPIIITLSYEYQAPDTNAHTFRVRAGANAAGTLTWNGRSGARTLGGVQESYMRIIEFKA